MARMNASDYRRLSARARSRDGGARLRAVDHLCVLAVACAYALMLAWLLFTGDVRFWLVLLGPASGFLALSALRRALDRSRPYEVLDIEPLLDAHEKRGSFPSRHVFSSALIAVALAPVQPLAAAGIGILTALIAWIRVVGGVHWPQDVIAGACLGVLWGLASYGVALACGLPL